MTVPTTLIIVDKKYWNIEHILGDMGSLGVVGCAVISTALDAADGSTIIAVRSAIGMSDAGLNTFAGDLHSMCRVPVDQIIRIGSILSDERAAEFVNERVKVIMGRCEIESHA